MNAAPYMIRERITETHGCLDNNIDFILFYETDDDILSKRIERFHANICYFPSNDNKTCIRLMRLLQIFVKDY